MNVFSRKILISALALLIFTSSCNLPAQTPPPVGTFIPTSQITMTVLPTDTLTVETPSAVIPITGMFEVSMQCQFCVNDEPHAVLILPERASFLVSDPVVGINCITAQIVNEKRILFCRGAQQTVFTLNVCAEGTNCNQYSITLETCPLNPKAVPVNATPVVLSPINTSAAPTLPASPFPTATQVVSSTPPVAATTTPLPTATFPPIPTATAALPQPSATLPPAATPTVNGPQSRGTPLPSTRLPRTGLYDPEGFIRWYFEAVWKERAYQDLWTNYLTESFKTRTGSSNYEDYAAWWDSVERVDVNSVSVLQNDGKQAWVRVNITFHMKDGRVISNQEYDYDLLFDATRQTWMFDYHL